MVAPLFALGMTAGSTTPVLEEPTIYEAPKASSTEKVAEDDIIEGENSSESVEKPKKDATYHSDVRDALESKFGADHPLIAVAKCESGYRQFLPDGSVLRGHINPQDVGVFQINEGYHLAAAERLGIDIYTLEGNMEYAERLYQSQGLTPWNWSKPCWG